MTIKLRFALAVAAVGLGTILPSHAGAYTTLGPTWPQLPVPYYINPANKDVPTAAIEPAIRAGADAWPLQSGTSFTFTFAGFSNQTTNTLDGINLVMFRNASMGSAIATTYSWWSGADIVDADIVFWDGGFEFFTGSSGCVNGFYIEDIATHEFGHVLGLGHSTDPDATMYPTVNYCSTQLRTLAADDIAGVLSLYPLAPPPAPKGLRIVR